MNKIVELIINFEEFELEDLGVEVLSLVESPAIEVNWMAFANEEFIDKIPGESKDDYVSRCIPVLIGEGYDQDQASAICYNSYSNSFSSKDLVDNTGFEKFAKFFEANQELFSVNNTDMSASGGMNHKEMTEMLQEKGVNTDYPFGYCYPVSQFMFYMLDGYEGDYDLKCAKKMEYEVNGMLATTTHWFIQNKKTDRIIDLTASQFDGLLDVNQWYPKATRANLGFPYYNLEDDKRAEFENTVPSLQVLKVYDKWREENEILPGLEKYWKASKYEKLRKEFSEMDFAAVGEEVDDERKAFEEHVIEVARKVGETIDPSEIIYVDASKEQFATVEEVLQGIRALNILGELSEEAKESQGVLRYRYAGPSGQRTFCATLKALNKIYSREDITRMNRFNPGFGIGGSNSYSVFEYKGGPSCQHFWEQLIQYEQGGRNVLVSLGPAEGDAGKTNNSGRPSSAGAVANNAYFHKTWAFSGDDKQIVTGPAMIPQQLIPRRDEMGNLFHVYFSKDTIERIARKFLADNNTHNTDINHNGNVVNENTLLESWIVEDPKMDKATAMGFNVPKGTWMTSVKINNKETWNKIKAGELNGFSVEGSFLEIVQK